MGAAARQKSERRHMKAKKKAETVQTCENEEVGVTATAGKHGMRVLGDSSDQFQLPASSDVEPGKVDPPSLPGSGPTEEGSSGVALGVPLASDPQQTPPVKLVPSCDQPKAQSVLQSGAATGSDTNEADNNLEDVRDDRKPQKSCTSFVIKRFTPPHNLDSSKWKRYQHFCKTAMQDVQVDLDRAAASVGGTLCLENRAGTLLLLLRVGEPCQRENNGGEAAAAGHESKPKHDSIMKRRADPADVVERMGMLVHNRYQIKQGRRTGLLLCDPDLPEHVRRAIEKERSLRKACNRGCRGRR